MKKQLFTAIALFVFISAFAQHFNYDQLSLSEKIKVKEKLHSPINFRGPNPDNHIFAEPEQDCNSAIPVCQNTYTQSQSYSGQGNNEEIPSNSSCLGSNEKNSVWYIFTVSASGNLAFNITPNNLGEDYDFALYEITNGGCAGIDNGSTTPIRCNFSATGGVTGLSGSGSNPSEDASGPNQSTVLPVTVGQTYVLVLSNYSSSQNGYTLDFSPSSASIFDVTPPTVLSTFAACGTTTLTVKFSEQVLCSSISANGSEFTVTGTGGPYTVTAAAGLNCGNSTNEVQLTLNTALSGGGPWTVSVGMGSDGNTLIDNCNNALNPPQTNVFNTSPAAASITGDNSICKGQTMALTASAGTSYSWSGPGTAGQNTNQTISVVQNAAGTFNYTVTVGNGTCGNSNANISVTVTDAPAANFTVPSMTVCAGNPVTFTNTSTYPCSTGGLGLDDCTCGTFFCNTTPNSGTFVTYLWTFGDGGTTFYLGGSPASAHSPTYTYSTPGVYTANLNASGLINTCDNNFSQTITVLPAAAPPTASASPTTICPGASSTLTASGGTTYTWTGPSGFNSASNPVTVTPASTATYTVSTPGCAGSNTTTVIVTVSTGTLSVGPIVGNNAVCPNATAVTYSVTNNAGSTYAWTVPAGATITAGQGTNAITVDFGASGGNVAVTETSGCNTGSATLAVSATSTTITPSIVGASSVCPNATAVTYSVSSTGSTYVWTVPAGATIASGQGTNTISVNFGTSGGNIGLTETTTCGSGNGTLTIAVNSTPVTSAITGPATVCPNATAITYSVTNTAGSTYAWSVPAGATIVSGQTTNSITVNFGATGGNVSVTETSACGVGTPVTTVVTTSSTPTTPPITGDLAVCAGSTTLYSVTNTVGSTYTWTVPAGAVITSTPINTNQISIDWTGSTGGTISVVENSTCGAGTTSTFTVAIINAPVVPTLTGTFIVCQNATAQTYSVTNNVGSTYTWTVTGDATITSGQSTNQINVNFGVTAGTITIREDNACGFAQFQQSYLLTPPPAVPVISGPTAVCAGTNYTYSVTNNPPNTYTWNVPAGATITGGQGTNSLTVNFAPSGGSVSVTENATCGNTASAPYAISITPAPTTPVITGSLNVCENATATSYSVTNNAGSSYAWTTTGGITIATGANTNSATANFTTAGGTITVTETNTCGNAPASITVTTTHVSINVSPASICPGFSTNLNATGATTYTWSPATGLNTTSGANVIANPTITTVYTISGSDGTCIGDTTATVTLLPPLTINLTSSTTNLCSGNTSTINASGADAYTWSPTATLSSSSGASVTASPAVTTTYTVVGSTASCAGTNTISVLVTPTPTITINPTDVTICEGETTIINVNGADSYIWPNAGSTIDFPDAPINSIAEVSPTSTQLYFVTGLKNGCPSNLDTLTVTVLPKINANAGPNDTICFGQTATLLGMGGQTYSWLPNFNLSTPTNAFTTATPFTTTDYTLTASYNGTCPQIDTVRVVVNPLPLVFAGNDTTIDVEDVVILNGYSSALGYTWLNGSTLNCTNCLSPIASPLETTTYILTATNQFGCSSADTVTIEVSQEYALYVPTALSPNEDLVNEGWKPQGFGIKKIQIWVFDRWGTKIFEAKDLDTVWNGTYKNDLVQQDVYVYKITAETYSGNKITKVGHVTVVR